MTRFRKGQKAVCVPCGREVVVSNAGISKATIWCCGKPMNTGTKKKKTVAKKTVNKKVAK